jgi:hypothetical protein
VKPFRLLEPSGGGTISSGKVSKPSLSPKSSGREADGVRCSDIDELLDCLLHGIPVVGGRNRSPPFPPLSLPLPLPAGAFDPIPFQCFVPSGSSGIVPDCTAVNSAILTYSCSGIPTFTFLFRKTILDARCSKLGLRWTAFGFPATESKEAFRPGPNGR